MQFPFHEKLTVVAKWSRYRIVAGLVTSSSPVPLKIRHVEDLGSTAFNEMLCDPRELADEIDISANLELTQPRHTVRRRNVNFDYAMRHEMIRQKILLCNIRPSLFFHIR
ncbi:hypothetical protein TNCV_1627911 [Trichonephila clavipes]|nr:hypothetical protein TNCV_1627911 [Trichonephila clavipes]